MMAAEKRNLPHRLSWLLPEIFKSGAEQDLDFADLRLDSRQIRSGDLFCALSGSRAHGLDYAGQVVSAGAAAILAEPDEHWSYAKLVAEHSRLGVPVIPVDNLSAKLSGLAGRLYGEPARSMELIGITGTNGKTSIARYLAQALDHELPCAMVGTLGYGFVDDLSATSHTTPDAIRLQAIFAELKQRGAAAVAMEVSSHALEQGRVAALGFETAIFTNLTRDHLDYHGDMQAYGRAKQRLFQQPGLKSAVLNRDDPFAGQIRDGLTGGVQTVLTSLNADWQPDADAWIKAIDIQAGHSGQTVTVDSSWGQGEFSTSLLGRFNISNLLAVLAVLMLRGQELSHALQALTRVTGAPGRMEAFGNREQPLVVVDYAHTPDALEQALTVLREHQPDRLICLFGCGGERDQGKRPLMAEVAERLSDLLIITDDNPRGEDGAAIIEDIKAGLQRPGEAQVQRNRGRAIRYGVCSASPGDILLVAGKGHENTQTIGDLVLPFSDRAQVVQALNERGGCR